MRRSRCGSCPSRRRSTCPCSTSRWACGATTTLRAELDDVLVEKRAQIDALLDRFGVPRVDGGAPRPPCPRRPGRRT
jgi:hypothetical protein